MAKYEGQDRCLDPETGVLKNKLGIEDEDELNKAEASLVAWRSFQLSRQPIRGNFDLDHLKAIHKHLFRDVYEWAGDLRDIDLHKGGSYFANHTNIVRSAQPRPELIRGILFPSRAGRGKFMTFEPNLTGLPPPQLPSWPELDVTPEHFRLYGGTALALRLGPRASVDFDFFSSQPFDPDELPAAVPYRSRAGSGCPGHTEIPSRAFRVCPGFVFWRTGPRAGRAA